MTIELERCCRIRHIVRLRQMLRRWRTKAASAASNSAAAPAGGKIPPDVPAGHVAVCVGTNSRRFVVRASYLNHPVFKMLLVQAEEEYGFSNHGPLAIPCDEAVFEEILRFMTRSDSGRFSTLEDFRRCSSQVDSRNVDYCWPESRPLLRGISDKSVW